MVTSATERDVDPPGVTICGEDQSKQAVALWADFVTHALSQIDVGHANVHLKRMFGISSHVTIASTKTAVIHFKTPASANGFVHLPWMMVGCSAGPVVAVLLEDYSATGTFGAITPVNMNRNTPPASALQTCEGTADGTLTAGSSPVTVAELYLPGASAGQRLGSASAVYSERVLKANTDYMLAISNQTSPGASAVAYYELAWYEEPYGG